MRDIRIYKVEAGSLRKYNWGNKGHKQTSIENAEAYILKLLTRPKFGYSNTKTNQQFVLMEYTSLYQAEIVKVLNYDNYGAGIIVTGTDITKKGDSN